MIPTWPIKCAMGSCLSLFFSLFSSTLCARARDIFGLFHLSFLFSQLFKSRYYMFFQKSTLNNTKKIIIYILLATEQVRSERKRERESSGIKRERREREREGNVIMKCAKLWHFFCKSTHMGRRDKREMKKTDIENHVHTSYKIYDDASRHKDRTLLYLFFCR